MAIAFYGTTISPHIDKTPEGYLVCRDVPINRTGTQTYLARELNLDGDPDREITVYRLPEDVFSPAAMSSFEGKDVTRGHPPEMLNADNQAAYSKGHLENVRHVGDNTVADLIIKDSSLASDVESGVLREVSCGYNCNFEPYLDGYKQTEIRGNHLAIVPRGRAGVTVSIQDTAPEAEKGGNKHMNEFWKSVLHAFGMAAKDASPEELDKMVETTANALDAEPAEKAPEAAPAESKPAEDEMIEKAPKGDDLGSKLDRIISMLEAKSRGGEGEHRLHDEGDIDEEIKRLLGKEEDGKSITIPVENDCMDAAAKDAAVAILRKVRPTVAAIEDKALRAKVTDSLLSAIRGKDVMGDIAKAAQDSAKAAQDKNSKNTYDTMCAESEASYAARNPHKKKEA